MLRAWLGTDGRILTGWHLPAGVTELARGPATALHQALAQVATKTPRGWQIPGNTPPSWPQIIETASRIERLIDRS